MANTYTLISSSTVATNTASVTFSSIPSTYTDLVIRCSNRTASGGVETLNIQLNGDTATNYSSTNVKGSGTAASNSRTTSDTSATMYTSDWSSDTANTFSNGEIYIPSYTVAQNKPIGTFGVEENNAAAAFITASASLWRSTAAVTSITLIYTGGNNHLAGSSFYLYGIKSS